ncbi:MAG: MbcA/ParS/Xre antitoxin family protein [Halieaceae bacterium]
MPKLAANTIEDRTLVTQAAINAATELGLSNRQLASTLGVSASKLDRARAANGAAFSGKDYELALLLIRIYRALYAILGGNREQIQHWMATPNRHLLNEPPQQQLQRLEGIVMVIRYLDGMRGRI